MKNKLISISRVTPLNLLKALRYEGIKTTEVTFMVTKFKGKYLYIASIK